MQSSNMIYIMKQHPFTVLRTKGAPVTYSWFGMWALLPGVRGIAHKAGGCAVLLVVALYTMSARAPYGMHAIWLSQVR
jgi:hypothetical protein